MYSIIYLYLYNIYETDTVNICIGFILSIREDIDLE